MRAVPFSLVLLALSAVLAAPVAAQTEAPLPTITVTGEGNIAAAPDLATIQIGVTTTGDTAAEALAANTASMDAVMARLAEAGILAADLQTSGLSVNPNWTGYDSSSSGGPAISGYTASNTLSVKVRAIDALGGVLDASVSDGANTLNGLVFGLNDPKPVLNEARKAAVADARARAELLAMAAGVKLGSIVSITEASYMPGPIVMYEKSALDAAVPVAGGEVGYSASVTVVWQLTE